MFKNPMGKVAGKLGGVVKRGGGGGSKMGGFAGALVAKSAQARRSAPPTTGIKSKAVAPPRRGPGGFARSAGTQLLGGMKPKTKPWGGGY